MTAAARADNQEPWWAREHIWALVVAIVLHALALYGLTRPTPLTDEEGAAMELVVLIPLPKPAATKSSPVTLKPPTKVAPPPVTAVNGPDASNTEDAIQVQDIQAQVAAQGLLSPVLVVQGDDTWDRPARTAPEADGLTFRRNPLHSAPNPLASTRPERIRMRKQLTPHDIVSGVSQLLGFWPPGYTDNPCGGIRRSVELFSGSTDDDSRWQLIEAIKAEQRYCR